MKKTLITLLVCGLFTLTNCTTKPTDNRLHAGNKAIAGDSTKAPELTEIVEPEYCDTVLVQDLNNDGISDTAFVLTPPTLASIDKQGTIHFEMGCANGDCYNKITFSCEAPELIFENSVWGTVENAGDLNGDGMNELIFCPGWFTSSMTHLYVYTLRNGKWEQVASVNHRRDYGETTLQSHIVKSGKRHFLKGIRFDGEDTPYREEVKF